MSLFTNTLTSSVTHYNPTLPTPLTTKKIQYHYTLMGGYL